MNIDALQFLFESCIYRDRKLFNAAADDSTLYLFLTD